MEAKNISKVERAIHLAREVICRWQEYKNNGTSEADLALVYITVEHFFKALMLFDTNELEGKIKRGRFDDSVDWLNFPTLTNDQIALIPLALPFALIRKYKIDLYYPRVEVFRDYSNKFGRYIELIN